MFIFTLIFAILDFLQYKTITFIVGWVFMNQAYLPIGRLGLTAAYNVFMRAECKNKLVWLAENILYRYNNLSSFVLVRYCGRSRISHGGGGR